MANNERRYLDRNGNMFIPMNVEGGTWNEHFMTTTKLVSLAVSLAAGGLLVAWLKGRYADLSAYLILGGIYLFGLQLVIRYVVFEERFYHRMYKNLVESETTTPALFWDIASIKETDDGAVMTYADGKIGILVKIERDTITGKNKGFMEDHYDALSDFYKDITSKKYSFIQLNVMEQAGNDPRLTELDKLVNKNSNPNISNLMERQVGHIKNITHRTLYETDYVLIYTRDLTMNESIINESMDSLFTLLDGAFIGFGVLGSKDIVEFAKEHYGVKYFNYTEATISMFKNHGIKLEKPIQLTDIVYSNGEQQKMGSRELNIFNKLASRVLDGTLDINKVSIKDTLATKGNKENKRGVDFDLISQGFGVEKGVGKGNRILPLLLRIG